ncbi:MAG: phosphoribosyl-AMP cyclohydrolase [Planctomycetota bacterium]
MNETTLHRTLTTRLATLFPRSRQKMWDKGESSGHTQHVVDARTDCDQDVVLLRCKSDGPCRHVGYTSCFYRRIEADEALTVIEDKAYDPDAVYKS